MSAMLASQQPIEHILPSHLGQLPNFVNQSAEQEADPRKLCILGLPWDTTDEALREYFSQFGPLEEATIIRKTRTGESRGFGFVTYRSTTDAQQVRMQEHSIGGRHCDAKQALPRGTANPSRETRLFIGRLPPSITDSELRDHFERFGKVQDAYIPKDPAAAKQAHRGFGFVTFANADDVDKVLSCAHTISDHEIAVQCAIPKEKGADLIQSRGAKWFQGALSNDSYPSSADSLTTIPGQMFYPPANPHLPGALPPFAHALHLPPHNGFSADLSLDNQTRHYMNGVHHPGDMPSTSGRVAQAPMQTGSSNGSLDRGHYDRLQFGPASTPSNAGSRRSSVDFNVQRLGSNDSSMANDQTIQALQGLTFGGSNDGIGIGLALLQARSQASHQPQTAAASMETISRQAFPPLHLSGHRQAVPQHPSLLHPSQLNAARQQHSGAVPRFPGRLMPGAPSYPASLNPYAAAAAAAPSLYNQPSTHYAPRGAPFGAPKVGLGDANAGPRMFVGKLNKETSEQDIKEYMTQFGYVLDVYMPRDKVRRNEHRGFGFVTFETPAAIQRVAQSGPHRIKGAIIVIDEAAPRKEEPQSVTELEEQLPHNVQLTGSVISPTATAAGAHSNGLATGASESSYGMAGIASPDSVSHPANSPTVGSLPTDASLSGGASHRQYPNQAHMFGSRTSFDQTRVSQDQNGTTDSIYRAAQSPHMDRGLSDYIQY